MRILNVGCGDSIEGTDFVDLYPQRKEIKKCDINKNKLPYKNETFDKIICNFLMEHLTNHDFAIKEMVRVLKKGGLLIIRTDNAGWWGYHNSESKWKTHYGGYKFHGEEDKHYCLFTFDHLINHLERNHIKIIKLELYQRDILGWKINLINKILSKTRFKWMAYPQIFISGRK